MAEHQAGRAYHAAPYQTRELRAISIATAATATAAQIAWSLYLMPRTSFVLVLLANAAAALIALGGLALVIAAKRGMSLAYAAAALIFGATNLWFFFVAIDGGGAVAEIGGALVVIGALYLLAWRSTNRQERTLADSG